jgi:hypothetical protein
MMSFEDITMSELKYKIKCRTEGDYIILQVNDYLPKFCDGDEINEYDNLYVIFNKNDAEKISNMIINAAKCEVMNKNNDKKMSTPGPWKVEESYLKPGRYEIRPTLRAKGFSCGFKPLAYVQGDKRVTGGDGEANARLMAKSPEMYYVLSLIANGAEDAQEMARKVLS